MYNNDKKALNNHFSKEIVFILGAISQPRSIKRIESFIRAGYSVSVYGYDRNIYNENAFIKGIEFHVLNKQKDGKDYLSKTVQVYKDIKTIIKNKDKNNSIFYSFGFVITFFTMLHKVLYVYEISDILYGYKKYNGIQWLLKTLDRYLINKSILTVMTSEGFLDFLFKGMKPLNIIIQPNRLSSNLLKINRPSAKKIDIEKISFSYVGAIRYPNTIFRFAKIIGEKYPNFQFHFYGESHLSGDAKKIAEKFENVFYHGAFKNPDDLIKIYQTIDILVACYDTSGVNERIAEPNKLYEALYFNKPIIVSEQTFLESQVLHYKCGYSITATKDVNIEHFLNSLNIQDLVNIQYNISNIKLTEIIDDDSAKIIDYLQSII